MQFQFISTAGHGYLKVAKSTIKKLGYDYTDISGFSGVNSTHVFLEEDEDTTNFLKFLDYKGIKYKVNEIYKEDIKTKHNFTNEAFKLVPEIGVKFKIHNDDSYEITRKIRGGWRIEGIDNNNIYKMSPQQMFSWGMIKEVL